MKDSKFWRLMAIGLVAGIFYLGFSISQVKTAGPAGAPQPSFMDMFMDSANADAPLILEFSEQSHDFIAVWNTDEQGNLHYRILRFPKGALKSQTKPELKAHVEYDLKGGENVHRFDKD